jgi:hypothetical protein
MEPCNVGMLRQQSALVEADTPVVLVTADESLMEALGELEIVRCYPDTTDERGSWRGTFKLQVRRKGA